MIEQAAGMWTILVRLQNPVLKEMHRNGGK